MSSEIVSDSPPEVGDVVVAIDFGSSRSAYSWTIIGNEASQVEVERAEGGTYCSLEVKVPTSVLIEIDECDVPSVLGFGTEAEVHYAEQEEPEPSWYLFRKFKLGLHLAFEDDPPVPSTAGRKLPMSVLLEKCLEWIKNDAMAKLKQKKVVLGGNPHGVVWVLSVPAIWSDFARHAMRRAAFSAGLISRVQSRRLVLALEPEAACVAFMAQPNQQGLLNSGDQFMIIDCGAGTLDITTHQLLSENPIKLGEVIPPTGGALGAMTIDDKFFEFLSSLLGEKRFRDFKTNNGGVFLDLSREWEEKKRQFQFDRSKSKHLLLRMGDVWEALAIQESIGALIAEWNGSHEQYQVNTRGSTMSLPFSLVYSFFDKPVQDVVDYVAEVIEKHSDALSGLKHLILAGGFANCKLLQERMRERFPSTLLGNQPDLLVVKGAAVFGANPMSLFKNRKAKYTYGVRTTVVYDEHDPMHVQHSDRKYIADDGKDRLNIFDIHGFMGDTIEVGSRTDRLPYYPISEEQTTIDVKVLATRSKVVFVSEALVLADDPDVDILGQTSVSIDMKKPFPDGRVVHVEFSFGKTEVECEVFDSEGDHLGKLDLDFNRFY